MAIASSFSKVKSPILIVVDTKIIKGKWDMDMLREAEEAQTLQ